MGPEGGVCRCRKPHLEALLRKIIDLPEVRFLLGKPGPGPQLVTRNLLRKYEGRNADTKVAKDSKKDITLGEELKVATQALKCLIIRDSAPT